MLINQELDNEDAFKSQYKQLYLELFQKNEQEITQMNSLSDTYFLVYIGCYFDWISPEDLDVLTSEEKIVQESDLEQDVYWYSMIGKLTDSKLDTMLVSSVISSFFVESGYTIAKSNPELINILSTYRMFVTAQNADISMDESFLSTFLENHQGDDGGYFVMAKTDEIIDYRDNFTLQSFYYGLSLEMLIS